jgi:hypothetical protein
MQCEWILSVIEKQCRENIATVESKKEAQAAWREHCLDLASKTLAIHTDSWYMGANVRILLSIISSETFANYTQQFLDTRQETGIPYLYGWYPGVAPGLLGCLGWMEGL